MATGRRDRATTRLIGLLVPAVCLVAVLGWWALTPGEPTSGSDRRLGEVCGMVARAATILETDADVALPIRYATAALVLDKAIVASARAVDAVPELADLDRAVRALHDAAHRSLDRPWRDALAEARGLCR